MLGDMGAEIVKVEEYPRAAMTRPPVAPPTAVGYSQNNPAGPRPWDRSATHNMCNRNKLGLALNLPTGKGQEVFYKLVEISDVVIDNYAPTAMDRTGIGYEKLREIKPDIIVISLPAWGNEGVMLPGAVTLGSGIDAFTGHLSLRGYPDADPGQTPNIYHTDATAAAGLAFACLSALHYRQRTGKGQFIDMSQAEAFLPHLGEHIMDYTMNGRGARPIGNRHRSMAPHGVYRCEGEDQWVAISCEDDAQWQLICQTMGKPELAQDERFADITARHNNQDELDALITDWTKDKKAYDVFHALQDLGVPAGPVIHDHEIVEDPHYDARGFFELTTHRYAGTHRYPGVLFNYTKTPIHIRIAPNTLGEHNEYVLGTLLNYTPDEIASLEDDNIIGNVLRVGADVDPSDR
jgi:crotonobetainyl-CoA:carnitine CoA-transferase CaiB-like acyl-CoA transferase